MRGSRWNDEMDADLRKMIAAGNSYTVAAAAINATFGTTFSRNAAIGRGDRIGLVSAQRRAPAKVKKLTRTSRTRETVRELDRAARIFDAVPLADIPEPAPSHAIDIMALTESTCHFPYGKGPYTFCGHAVKVGSPYCAAHHAECHDARYRAQAVNDAAASAIQQFEAA